MAAAVVTEAVVAATEAVAADSTEAEIAADVAAVATEVVAAAASTEAETEGHDPAEIAITTEPSGRRKASAPSVR